MHSITLAPRPASPAEITRALEYPDSIRAVLIDCTADHRRFQRQRERSTA